MQALSGALVGLTAAALLAPGCLGEATPEPGASGPSVAIDIAALNLQGVGDVVWDVEVDNGATTPEVVWQRRLASSSYGDGAGSASYVGPCDADPSVDQNTVKVWVVGVYAAPVTTLGTFASGGAGGVVGTPVDFQNPTVTAPLSQSVTCRANTDVAVQFDVSLMRPAQQGFFDIAVSFNDLFCSAKFDCCDDQDGTAGCAADGSEDIALLFDATGSRATTMVLGFACTAGARTDVLTELYLDALELDCTSPTDFTTGFAADVTIDPSFAVGNLCAAGQLASCGAVTGATADTYLYQVGAYRGSEALTSGGVAAKKVYWNVALGAKRPAIASCWLRTRGTADDVNDTGAVADRTIAAGTVYPFIRWEVKLDTCGSEQLSFGDASAMVRPDYTGTDSAATPFDYSYAPGSICSPDPCLNGGLCSDIAGGYTCTCAPGFSGDNCEIGAAASCQAIKDANPDAPSAIYPIDPDGGGPIAPFDAYCDMVTDGGGWMIIARVDTLSTSFAVGNADTGTLGGAAWNTNVASKVSYSEVMLAWNGDFVSRTLSASNLHGAGPARLTTTTAGEYFEYIQTDHHGAVQHTCIGPKSDTYGGLGGDLCTKIYTNGIDNGQYGWGLGTAMNVTADFDDRPGFFWNHQVIVINSGATISPAFDVGVRP